MNRKAFKVVCVIIIILGALSLLGVFTSFAAGLILAGIVSLVSSLVEIASGILGTQALKDPDKVKTVQTVAYIYLAVTVVAQIISIVQNTGLEVSGVSLLGPMLISAVISLILPILYILGAKKL